ncbi:MAG: ATP-binding protein [Candidatus Binatia bacterium]
MNDVSHKTPVRRQPATAEILAGGGDMGALMRSFDWTATPLGPAAGWPQSLRMAVSLCLDSQFPTVLFWGPELAMLYNDAYRPLLADKHPAALGRPAQEVWPEIWSIVGPMLHGVLDTGQATWSYDLLLPIIRNGAVGEHYFTFSYSPIRDEAGQVCGIFCPVTETTARLQGERREQALRAAAEAARDQVTHILEGMSDSFVAFDPQWRITAANASAAELMHQRREDLLGKVYWDEFPPARDTNLYTEFHRAMADRVPVKFENYYLPWGRWFEVDAYPAAPGGLSVFFQDITARKQAEEALRDSEERLRLATDSAEVGIWHCSVPEGRLIWSPQFKRLFGLPPDNAELTYQQFLDYVHPEDRQRMDGPVRQIFAEGKELEVEYRIVWPDGSVHWIGTKGRAFHDGPGGAVWFRGVALDITARKQAEEALARQAEDLQCSNEELQQFAYVASHDLQEPLRTVSGFVQLLAKRYQGKLDTDADEFIGFVLDGTQRMQALIRDLLAYARVGIQEQARAATDCEVVLEQTLQTLRIAIEQSGAQVTHDPLPLVTVNEGQLGQVFQNLIGNALKFRGPQPPRVHVSARQDGRQWVFTVRDNGIGLDSQYAQRIFQVFQRLHSRKEYAGTGIGLAICKKVIERHGGRIWVESAPGTGSTFFFTISGIEERKDKD